MKKWLFNIESLNLFDLLDIVLVGIIIFFINFVIKKYLIDYFYPSPVRKKKAKSRFPVIETLTWIFYSVYVLYIVVTPFPLIGLFFIALATILSKKQLSNLVNGLFIRSKGLLSVGQQITIDDKSGVITEVGVFGIKLEDNEGKFQLISYSVMHQKEVVMQEMDKDFFSTRFSVVSNKLFSEKAVVHFIQKHAFSVETKFPAIEIVQNEDKNQYNITIYAIDRSHLDFLKADIRSFLG